MPTNEHCAWSWTGCIGLVVATMLLTDASPASACSCTGYGYFEATVLIAGDVDVPRNAWVIVRVETNGTVVADEPRSPHPRSATFGYAHPYLRRSVDGRPVSFALERWPVDDGVFLVLRPRAPLDAETRYAVGMEGTFLQPGARQDPEGVAPVSTRAIGSFETGNAFDERAPFDSLPSRVDIWGRDDCAYRDRLAISLDSEVWDDCTPPERLLRLFWEVEAPLAEVDGPPSAVDRHGFAGFGVCRDGQHDLSTLGTVVRVVTMDLAGHRGRPYEIRIGNTEGVRPEDVSVRIVPLGRAPTRSERWRAWLDSPDAGRLRVGAWTLLGAIALLTAAARVARRRRASRDTSMDSNLPHDP